MAIQGSLQAVILTMSRQKARLKSLFSNHELNNDRMNKRALEILGSFLSTITWVPSARDHRKVIEE